jgi:hypothetical protein
LLTAKKITNIKPVCLLTYSGRLFFQHQSYDSDCNENQPSLSQAKLVTTMALIDVGKAA